ncbi:MAG TPA: flagellar hook protein FlgE [Acetobacteraceae bacterium]|nr:flagellar hook protein FlgE [Acetobacteraceae bacterium]
MSLLGAMNTAISGLTAQSAAFGNISDNVANSQTVGYKRVDTNFVDYLTTSNATTNDPGAVVARPAYVNNVQGTVTQTDNPLGLAIAGQGFFAVSQSTGQVNSIPTFNPQQFYTRAGDFQLNSSGYLVNSAGEYLNGWTVDPSSGVVNQNSLAPIQVTQTVYNPVPTSTVTLSANLPATPATGSATATAPISSDIDVYDSLGTQHVITLQWVQNAASDWTVSVNSPDDITTPGVIGSADVQFGALSGNPVPAGTVGNIGSTTGTVTSAGYTAGSAATLSFTTDFGSGAQTIQLNIGTYGQTSGVTQYAGTQYNLEGLTQNGVPPGSFAGVTPQANGDIVVNYNNGQTRTIAQVPVITFNSPNVLQRQNGQSFTATLGAGTPLAEQASTNGAGNLVTNSVESSNVDIATEFSNLIVAQQAYSANAKLVTTAQQMLQTTVDMKQ